MPFFTVFFISLLNMLFLTKTYLCMETDFCEPVQLDRENFPSHLTKFSENLSKGLVVYKISAFNHEFYLSLLPDASFLAHGGTYHHDTSSSNAFQGPDFKGCFYSGHINSDKKSYAAVSLCRGVRGAFSFREMEYFIERTSINTPAELDSGDAGKTHIIRRRNVTENATSRCGVTSSSNQGVVESLEKYRHLKGHTMNITETLGRSKRFASIPRYVEVLVVADESMAKFHGDDLKHYLLTLMSVTANLYKHPSILNFISIVVVKLMVINEAEKGPKVSSNAALTLRNFCTWQKKLNKVNDKHPEYWDTAILFTKQDLCGATTCDTLGMADVGTMCDPKRSCSVIEDDGLPSAFTTAHELGHVFSMPHDNVKACEEVFGKLKDNNMMSPTLIQIDHISPWSVCSAAIITDFLDSGHGDCLLDQPQKILALPGDPPGVTYPLTRQCELAFGSGSKPCPYMQPCSKLWCTGKAKGQLVCQTRHFPWADGTNCGTNKLCYRGTCNDKQSIATMKVDGRWGRWGHYGPCSRTCGGGVQLAKRDCNNPVPANGGKYCQGLRVKHRSCNLNPCKETGKSFREEQCEAFNGFNLNTNRLSPSVVWVPKYSGVSVKDRCKLICKANGTGYFYVLSPKVVDGTPCSPDTSAVCVQGKCIKAGCDSKLNSDVKFDKCGVCGGDNQNCKKVSGMFVKPMQRGYQGLVNDDNYLAVKNVHGNYLLNGNFVVSAVEKDIIVKGSLLRYSGTGTAVEVLQATRPLKESLTVELLSVGKMTPPRVRYSYYVNLGNKQDKTLKKEDRNPAHNSVLEDNKVELKKPANQTPSYKWVAVDWNKCSVTCGNGVQSRRIQCLDSDGKTATRCDNNQKPSTMRVCGDPCPMWSVGEWSPCSKTCGKGFKRRLPRCITQTGMHLPRDQCSNRKKPQELDFCTIQSCQ
ncbi:A disintegrin and metalloproteinase with thrombospondin motifs 15 [Triplophysa tibetana]|uniref:A disintegrin and metalloproteinase with thrombospondin motifs 15 n=1 Tax=Triplophysa tibetana TaxID=1572043 RepID=A0A5A9N036_9TELE|nr:A disintegrin and metalloproteinase with thrombospondin motifs 15 [Triplophysa tibetana]